MQSIEMISSVLYNDMRSILPHHSRPCHHRDNEDNELIVLNIVGQRVHAADQAVLVGYGKKELVERHGQCNNMYIKK